MNKKEFLEYFALEEKNQISHLFEKYEFSYFSGVETFTEEFYPPTVWAKLVGIKDKLNLEINAYGYFEEAERRLVFFNSEIFGARKILKLIKIKNLSKFKELNHRDYLGAIMALGIKREKIGDLIVKNENCYLTTFDGIGNIIIGELKTVGKNPVEVSWIEEDLQINHSFEINNYIIASNRLDALIGAICKVSRQEGINLIERGDVQLGYIVCKEKSKSIKEMTIISIKSHGKFQFLGKIGETKKEKEKISVKKFI